MKTLVSLSSLLLVCSAGGLMATPAAQPDEAAVVSALKLGDSLPTGKLELYYQNEDRVQSEAENQDKASRIRSIRAGVVGKDRLLFVIKFDHPPVLERSSFCLYLDVDNDRSTGRDKPGVEGVDLMALLNTRDDQEPYLSFKSPFLNVSQSGLQAAWEGDTLYITIQTPLGSAHGPIRFFVLSQKDGGKSNFTTPDDIVLSVVQEDTRLPALN